MTNTETTETTTTTRKSKRTDPHRPGAIVPAEYTALLSFNLATSDGGMPMPACGVSCEIDYRTERKREDGTTELLPALEALGDGGGHVGSYAGCTRAFITGLRRAHDAGESVVFA